MKKTFLLLIYLLPLSFVAHGQYKIDSLNQIKNKVMNQILDLNKFLITIDSQIKIQQNLLLLTEIKGGTIYGICKDSVSLRVFPEIESDVTIKLYKGDRVKIIDYSKGFVGVCKDSFCGYVSDVFLEKTEEVVNFVKYHENKEVELERSYSNANSKEHLNELNNIKNRVIKKHGQTKYNKLTQGYYWLGIDTDMAIVALGYPEKVNRSVGVWGVHEQWIYGNGLYLYFENGILTSYQD